MFSDVSVLSGFSISSDFKFTVPDVSSFDSGGLICLGNSPKAGSVGSVGSVGILSGSFWSSKGLLACANSASELLFPEVSVSAFADMPSSDCAASLSILDDLPSNAGNAGFSPLSIVPAPEGNCGSTF